MRILFVCLLLALICNAEEIKAIKYEGLLRISPLMANEITNITTGDTLDEKKIDAAIIALYKQDYFDDIYTSFDNGILTFHFKEKPSINNVEIKGYGNDQETEDILKRINIKKGDTYDIYKEKYAKDVITSALEDKGYYGSVIEVDDVRTDGAINLTFNVNKGEHIIIRKSYYEGATLDKKDLESLSANKERNKWLGWLPWWPNGELKLKELEYDNMRVQDVYMQKGYLDANVSIPLLSANFTDYDATLIYKVVEGERYKVSDVEIEISDDTNGEFNIKDLEDLLKLKKDEYFNIQTLRQDVESLKSYIMDKGYAYVVINPDLPKDTESKKVKVVYKISIGKKVYIHDVIVTGNTTSSDRIVRREMIIFPGDLYSITNIRKSENALKRTGFFDKVNVSEIRINDTSMNLLVEVTEGKTGEIMAGIGYGSYDKFMVNGSLRERNLFGTGIGGQLQINWSKYNQLYNIGLTNPRVLDSEYSVSLNVFHSYYASYYSYGFYDDSDIDYVENTNGFNVSVGRNLTEETNISLTYGLSKSQLSDFNFNGLNYGVYYPKEGIWKSYIGPGIYFDNTDDYYFPKNGTILQGNVDFAGLGGNSRYVKLYGKAGFYYYLKNIVDFDLILRYKAQIGAMYPFSKNEELMTQTQTKGIPITDTFYMGGIGTVRGYNSGRVSPMDSNGLRIGGNYLFSNSVEASYGILEAINMRLALFFDYGMIGRHKFDEIQVMSAGFSIEWVSPIGPLVFVFPWAINPPKEFRDEVSHFEFTMGTRF